jgi:hypothetical protein
MSATDADDRGRSDAIDADWEPADRPRRTRRESQGGVGLGTALLLALLATIGGGLIGAMLPRSPQGQAFLDSLYPGGAGGASPAALLADMNAAKTGLTDIEARLKRLEGSLQAVSPANGAGEAATLMGQVLSLRQSVGALQSRIGDANLAQWQQDMANIREAQSRLEGDIATAGTAARAAFAVAAAGDAARSSGPFDQAYTSLATLLPNDPNVAALGPLSRTGAPTRAELRDELDGLSTEIVRASRVANSGSGFWGRVNAFFAQFITVRRAGEGDTVDGMVERAVKRMGNDDLPGAFAELSRLTGPSADIAGPWLQKARARLDIDARLSAIRNELARRT